jgi:hypothetical protein
MAMNVASASIAIRTFLFQKACVASAAMGVSWPFWLTSIVPRRIRKTRSTFLLVKTRKYQLRRKSPSGRLFRMMSDCNKPLSHLEYGRKMMFKQMFRLARNRCKSLSLRMLEFV